MELWRELLINGLQNESTMFDNFNDNVLIDVIEKQCYKVLEQIKQTLDNEILTDEDCFNKIEKLLHVLEQNGIFCDRQDF